MIKNDRDSKSGRATKVSSVEIMIDPRLNGTSHK